MSQASPYVRSFNEDGRRFIRDSAKSLLETDLCVDTTPQQSRRYKNHGTSDVQNWRPQHIVHCPKTFDHYIMNLPASAIQFLPAFVGLYADHRTLFETDQPRKLPMIHVYCFNTKSDNGEAEAIKICEEISEHLGYPMKPGDPEIESEVQIRDVRGVAPNKTMYCASFRLPRDIAFRSV